jgi:hypothetical protein
MSTSDPPDTRPTPAPPTLPDDDSAVEQRIRDRLHKVVLMRETGPKSGAWQRARVRAIWRLHALLDRWRKADEQE